MSNQVPHKCRRCDKISICTDCHDLMKVVECNLFYPGNPDEVTKFNDSRKYGTGAFTLKLRSE